MIVCTGPESSGKSTLAEQLALALGGVLVPEAARQVLPGLGNRYLPSDVYHIAEQQMRAEQAALNSGNSPIICDTDLQVICIWWQERFGPIPAPLVSAYAAQAPRVYLLCYPDLPWEPDPLRENPLDRERLFDLYEKDATARHLTYHIVRGQGDARLAGALDALKSLGITPPAHFGR